jgi:hypothetical protein
MPAPQKIDAEMKRSFVRAIRKGSTITAACHTLGVTRWNLHLARQSDTAFDQAVRQAAHVLIDRVSDVVAEKALAGDMRAAEFFLVNRSRQLGLPPEHRWEHVSKIDVNARVTAGRDGETRSLSDEELEMIIRRDQEQRALPNATGEAPADPYEAIDEDPGVVAASQDGTPMPVPVVQASSDGTGGVETAPPSAKRGGRGRSERRHGETDA